MRFRERHIAAGSPPGNSMTPLFIKNFVMLNAVKHLFCSIHNLQIDPSFLRMTNWKGLRQKLTCHSV
jgi:5'(3')-deoxyribonucleotidase